MNPRTRRTVSFCSFFIILALTAAIPRAARAWTPSRIGGRLADRGDGTLMFAARKLNGSIAFGQKADLTGGPLTWSWYDLEGALSSNPVVIINANGKAIVFARGTDGRIYFRKEATAGDPATFAWWDVIDSGSPFDGFRGDPALVRLGDGRLAVFATANNGAVYTSSQSTAGGAWSGWSSLGTPGKSLTTSTVVALNANGALSIFARGSDNALWTRQQKAAGGSWYDWSSLGYKLMNTPADCISVTYDSQNRLAVAVNDSGGTVGFRTQSSASSTNWNAWMKIPGGAHAISRPSAARNADGRLTVWLQPNYGTTTPSLQYQSQTAPGVSTWWQDYRTYPSGAASSPVSLTDVNGLIHVFALDSGSYVHEAIQTAPSSDSYTPWWDHASLAFQFADL